MRKYQKMNVLADVTSTARGLHFSLSLYLLISFFVFTCHECSDESAHEHAQTRLSLRCLYTGPSDDCKHFTQNKLYKKNIFIEFKIYI